MIYCLEKRRRKSLISGPVYFKRYKTRYKVFLGKIWQCFQEHIYQWSLLCEWCLTQTAVRRWSNPNAWAVEKKKKKTALPRALEWNPRTEGAGITINSPCVLADRHHLTSPPENQEDNMRRIEGSVLPSIVPRSAGSTPSVQRGRSSRTPSLTRF